MGQMDHTALRQGAESMHLHQLDRSVVAEHRSSFGHHINFKDATVFANAVDHVNHIVREATEVLLHPDIFDREHRIHSKTNSGTQPLTYLDKIGLLSNSGRKDQ
jgi:pterin-4a-carbinolamine dehydratase